jgi:hypothetical protein
MDQWDQNNKLWTTSWQVLLERTLWTFSNVLSYKSQASSTFCKYTWIVMDKKEPTVYFFPTKLSWWARKHLIWSGQRTAKNLENDMTTFSILDNFLHILWRSSTSCLQELYFEYNSSFAMSLHARQILTARYSSCKLTTHAPHWQIMKNTLRSFQQTYSLSSTLCDLLFQGTTTSFLYLMAKQQRT